MIFFRSFGYNTRIMERNALCRLAWSSVAVLGTLLVAHCGGGHEEHTVDEAGCEHIVEPFDAVQETATVDIATAPGQTHEHVHERINLVPFEGGMGGFVKIGRASCRERV